jgi:uncharacterized protein (DUF4415 family)
MPGPSDRIRRPDPIKAAEAAFRKATTKPLEAPPKPAILPQGKETVSLKLDRDVLAVYQEDGPGWQERINAALRKAAGLNGPGPRDEGMRPEQLTAENDD